MKCLPNFFSSFALPQECTILSVMFQCCERLSEPIESCDPSRDIQTVVSLKGNGAPTQDQLLPDFYAEHITLAMNRERRRQALAKLLQLIRQVFLKLQSSVLFSSGSFFYGPKVQMFVGLKPNRSLDVHVTEGRILYAGIRTQDLFFEGPAL